MNTLTLLLRHFIIVCRNSWIFIDEHIDITAETLYIVYRNSWIFIYEHDDIIAETLSVDNERNIDITAETLCRLETMDYFMNIFRLLLRHIYLID